METDNTLARLTFNAVATRAFFNDRSNGVRLRIESGVIAFRPVAARRGVDVLALERRTRGVVAEVPRDTLTRRLMQRLFKDGLSETQPYFTLEESTPRGWFSIDHHPADQPPQRRALMVVSEFDPPPITIDMGLWRRLQRAMTGTKPIALPLWQDFMAMCHNAIRLTERPARARSKSGERSQAERLLVTIERNVGDFQALATRQPELSDDIASLLFSVTGESIEDANTSVIEFPTNRLASNRLADAEEDRPEIDRQYVEDVLAAVETKSSPTKPKRQPRRKWPDLTEEDIRSAVRLMDPDPVPSEPDPVSDNETIDEIDIASPAETDVTEVESDAPEPESVESEPESDEPEGVEVDDQPVPEERDSPPLAAEAFEPEAELETERETKLDELRKGESEAEPVVDFIISANVIDTESEPEPEEAEIETDQPTDEESEADVEAEVETDQYEESEADIEAEKDHEGEVDFDLPDGIAPRSQPDRDEEALGEDEEAEDEAKKPE